MARKPSSKEKNPAGPDPKGPPNPYPLDDPVDPHGPGSEPDILPGKSDNTLPRFERPEK
jgi:hypothetical protein